MWLLGVLCLVWLALGWTALLGRAATRALPRRVRPSARLYFAPILGCAVLVLLAAATGLLWGHSPVWVRPFTVALGAVALWLDRANRREWTRSAVLLLAAALIASPGLWIALGRFDIFPVYNDTFSYAVHAQWLNQHAFRETVTPSADQPALSQLVIWQRYDMRMGASFVLSWLHALSGEAWSYRSYPAAIGLFLAAAAFAFAGLLRALFRVPRAGALLLGAMVPLTANGLTHGAVHGYLAQSAGLAFGSGAIGVWQLAGRLSWRPAAPAGLLLAAHLHCYPEALPLTLGGLAVPAVLGRRPGCLLRLLAWFALFANAEIWRAASGFRHQLQAVVGGPMTRNPFLLWLHSLGLASGPLDPQPLDPLRYAVLLWILAFFLVWLWFARRRLAPLWRSPLPPIALAGCAGFLYFGYVARNPWDGQVGHAFNQWRILGWTSLVWMALLLSGVAALWRLARRPRRVVLLFLGVLAAWNLAREFQLALPRTSLIRLDFAAVGHTFDVPAQMARQLSAIPSTEPIALWSGPPHSFPERRWVAYFLAGRRLVADWSSDEYLRPGLPPGAAQPAARWRIERGFADPAAGQGVRIGGLILGSAAPRFALLSAAGGYDQERDESGWWYWTARELRFHLRAEGGAPPQARLRLRYLLAPASRQVSVRITSGGREVSFALPAVEGWQDYQSEPLPIAGPSDVIVVFTTTGAPVRISDSDPRLMAFLIKNLVVEP